jgi:secreted trypsin-like serine protease
MSVIRRVIAVSVATAALIAATAAPSSAVVGGNAAGPGEYPSVAEVTFGPFLCTGTLVTPDWVLTAGHCGSVTGAAVASPAGWPPQLINVRIGGVTQSDGEQRSVSQVVVNPNYLLTSGYDISLLKLSQSSTMAPTQVAGAGERSTWTAGTLETIVGWGATQEEGDLPDNLQEARVPITTDAYCAGAYSDFDPQTMVCAGFPQGGVDTCQGDSGGPMFGKNSAGALRIVGTTSFGEGCARPGRPGVYARVADDTLRPWIAETTGGGGVSTTAVSRVSKRAKVRRAKRRAAERRWARRHHRAASSNVLPR